MTACVYNTEMKVGSLGTITLEAKCALLKIIPYLKDKYQHYKGTFGTFILFLIFAMMHYASEVRRMSVRVVFDGVRNIKEILTFGDATDKKRRKQVCM